MNNPQAEPKLDQPVTEEIARTPHSIGVFVPKQDIAETAADEGEEEGDGEGDGEGEAEKPAPPAAKPAKRSK